MSSHLLELLVLGLAASPFAYYLIALYSSCVFFRSSPRTNKVSDFCPPVSILKPIRGLDPDAYENFATLCRQDYPMYEILFCVTDREEPTIPVLEQLARDFPEQSIRIILGSERAGANDKVAKLARLVGEASYETLVISDSDVRVGPEYLRTVIAPLKDPKVGAVTCFYVSAGDTTMTEHLQSIGMYSDFYPGILVARQLDGIKFALGPTIATTRSHLAVFDGYESLVNRPADDLLVGRLIAEAGYTVKLLPYAVRTVSDYRGLRDLLHKRLRWMVVMRHMRPWGHLGLLFTLGLPWTVLVTILPISTAIKVVYVFAYLTLRLIITCVVGTWGLQQKALWKDLPLVIVWDVVAFAIWLTSSLSTSIRWRGTRYYLRNGALVPAAAEATPNQNVGSS
jgi:ceramide glucosyltransferase